MSVLQVTPREATGHGAKHLRKRGIVPMALIKKKDHEIQLIQAPAMQVRKVVSAAHGVGMFDIHVEGDAKPVSVIIKQIDQNYMTKGINNITVMEVSKDDLITADIPVTHIGVPEAVDAGTALLGSPNSTVKIKGKVSELPDHFEMDVSGLEIGGHILASDIVLPEGIELLTPPDTLLFNVVIAKEPELEPEVTEEEGAEPGVAGEEPAAGEEPPSEE